MRWHVLWILFFVSTVAVRARNRRTINEVMIDLADSTSETNHGKAIAKRATDTENLLKTLSNFISSILSFSLSIPENVLNMVECFVREIFHIIESIWSVRSLHQVTNELERIYTCFPKPMQFSWTATTWSATNILHVLIIRKNLKRKDIHPKDYYFSPINRDRSLFNPLFSCTIKAKWKNCLICRRK